MRRFTVFLLGLQLLTLAEPAMAAWELENPDGMSPAMSYSESIHMLSPMKDGLMHPDMPLSRMDLVSGIVHTVYPNDVSDLCFDHLAPTVPAHFTWLFTDVARDSVHAKEVCVGMMTGMLEGKPDGSLGPWQSANLVETAKMLTKAYGIAPKPALRPVSGIPWHEPYWYALAKRNAIPASVKDRQASLTRGEFAQIVYILQSDRASVAAHRTATVSTAPSEPTDAVLMHERIELRRQVRVAKWQAALLG